MKRSAPPLASRASTLNRAGPGAGAAEIAVVENLQRRVRVFPVRLRQTAAGALRALGRTGGRVQVTVVDDRSIRRLHARHLDDDTPTDVLTFDLAGPGPDRLLGEVIVSAQTAARQARRLRVPVALEMDLLVIHGILHLSGHDDRDPRAARRMHRRARVILAGVRGPRRPVPSRLWVGLLPPDARAPGPPGRGPRPSRRRARRTAR